MEAERVCSDCERPRPVMLEMVPGKDGKPWWICTVCYRDARQMKLGRRKMVAEPVSQEMIDALKATGWTVTDNGDGTETVSPPDRPGRAVRR